MTLIPDKFQIDSNIKQNVKTLYLPLIITVILAETTRLNYSINFLKMEDINLFPVMHRGAEQILIKCPNVKSINDHIKKIQGVKWSQTHKSWYLPLSKENYHLIHQSLHQLATLKTDELKKYLVKKKMSDR
jgi:hypothetical protein